MTNPRNPSGAGKKVSDQPITRAYGRTRNDANLDRVNNNTIVDEDNEDAVTDNVALEDDAGSDEKLEEEQKTKTKFKPREQNKSTAKGQEQSVEEEMKGIFEQEYRKAFQSILEGIKRQPDENHNYEIICRKVPSKNCEARSNNQDEHRGYTDKNSPESGPKSPVYGAAPEYRPPSGVGMMNSPFVPNRQGQNQNQWIHNPQFQPNNNNNGRPVTCNPRCPWPCPGQAKSNLNQNGLNPNQPYRSSPLMHNFKHSGQNNKGNLDQIRMPSTQLCYQMWGMDNDCGGCCGGGGFTSQYSCFDQGQGGTQAFGCNDGGCNDNSNANNDCNNPCPCDTSPPPPSRPRFTSSFPPPLPPVDNKRRYPPTPKSPRSPRSPRRSTCHVPPGPSVQPSPPCDDPCQGVPDNDQCFQDGPCPCDPCNPYGPGPDPCNPYPCNDPCGSCPCPCPDPCNPCPCQCPCNPCCGNNTCYPPCSITCGPVTTTTCPCPCACRCPCQNHCQCPCPCQCPCQNPCQCPCKNSCQCPCQNPCQCPCQNPCQCPCNCPCQCPCPTNPCVCPCVCPCPCPCPCCPCPQPCCNKKPCCCKNNGCNDCCNDDCCCNDCCCSDPCGFCRPEGWYIAGYRQFSFYNYIMGYNCTYEMQKKKKIIRHGVTAECTCDECGNCCCVTTKDSKACGTGKKGKGGGFDDSNGGEDASDSGAGGGEDDDDDDDDKGFKGKCLPTVCMRAASNIRTCCPVLGRARRCISYSDRTMPVTASCDLRYF